MDSFILLGKDKCTNVLIYFCQIAPEVAKAISYKKDKKGLDKVTGVLGNIASTSSQYQTGLSLQATDAKNTISDPIFR